MSSWCGFCGAESARKVFDFLHEFGGCGEEPFGAEVAIEEVIEEVDCRNSGGDVGGIGEFADESVSELYNEFFEGFGVGGWDSGGIEDIEVSSLKFGGPLEDIFDGPEVAQEGCGFVEKSKRSIE